MLLTKKAELMTANNAHIVGKESSNQSRHWRLCVGMVSLGQDWLGGERHVASHRSDESPGMLWGNDQGKQPYRRTFHRLILTDRNDERRARFAEAAVARHAD
jgi:hypothetical protein